MAETYLKALADLFYPQRCVGCGVRASDLLCAGCHEALPFIQPPVCRRCGLPTAFDTPVCEDCKGRDLFFDAARAPLRYEGVGKEIVHTLKYRGYLAVVPRLSGPMMIRAALEAGWGRFDRIVPIPLHRSRMARRGFNQAAVLAREVAGGLGCGFEDSLQAVRGTRDQVHLSAAERRANVRGAFRARSRVGGRVLLVDDVLTTGATLSEGARVLREAGADEIYALCLCRAC
jgi:ComF family protein